MLPSRHAAPCVLRLLSFALLLVSPLWVRATQLRAAEISAEQVSCDNLFQYKITVYLNTASEVYFGDGSLEFGGNTSNVSRFFLLYRHS